MQRSDPGTEEQRGGPRGGSGSRAQKPFQTSSHFFLYLMAAYIYIYYKKKQRWSIMGSGLNLDIVQSWKKKPNAKKLLAGSVSLVPL